MCGQPAEVSGTNATVFGGQFFASHTAGHLLLPAVLNSTNETSHSCIPPVPLHTPINISDQSKAYLKLSVIAADKVVRLQPEWAEGHKRLGAALASAEERVKVCAAACLLGLVYLLHCCLAG